MWKEESEESNSYEAFVVCSQEHSCDLGGFWWEKQSRSPIIRSIQSVLVDFGER